MKKLKNGKKINSRQKGKRGERYFKNLLKEYFPNIQRNANEQSARGGVDLINTDPFDFEVKNGYKNKAIRSFINQVEREGKEDNYKVILIKPDREAAYAVIPIDSFLNILSRL